jgi:DNA mismatch endonuclease (patch repair protein)
LKAQLATDATTQRRMSRQRRRDTSPELALRSVLHRSGLRYRVHRKPVATLRREADIVFVRARVAVFVDGCFWHKCPQHATFPRNNRQWWRQKLDRNVERDRETDKALRAAGWLPMRVWEHDDPKKAAVKIERAVRRRRSPSERTGL